MRRLISILFLLLALAACTASNSTDGQISSSEESASEAALPSEVGASFPSAEESAPTEVEATPTIHPDYKPTDPATFVRAAGHLQFVEFFAYW